VLCWPGLQIVLLSSLKTFVVASNKLTGTVNENIYYLPALAKLDLSNNTLVGTTPPAIGYVSSTGVQAPRIDSCAGITAPAAYCVSALACTAGTPATVPDTGCQGLCRSSRASAQMHCCLVLLALVGERQADSLLCCCVC
jgi:hypothetical protein